MLMNIISAETVNRLLPQTQCRECGFDGCLPYAEALSRGESSINLCAPGGETVMRDLSALLNRPPQAPAKIQMPALAWIDEAVCIGCTACIRVCPTDAVMGASKLMHTVISDECTGCGLCIPACPVDCIYMKPVADTHLPRARSLGNSNEPRFTAAEHALSRYTWRNERRERDAAERKAQLAEREAAARARLQNTPSTDSSSKTAFNPAALIAQAMARANAQQQQRSVPANRESFKEQQIREAREKATFRRYQRDAQYGSGDTKTAAIEWLRQYKAEQEAKQTAKPGK